MSEADRIAAREFKVALRSLCAQADSGTLRVWLAHARRMVSMFGPCGVANREPWMVTRVAIIRATLDARASV